MNGDERLDQLIRASLEWQAKQAARRAPSLGQSVRAVAERVGPQTNGIVPVIVARPGSGRGFELIVVVALLALLATAVAVVVGRTQQFTLPTGPSGSTVDPRGAGHAIVALPDGRVLVVGGWEGFGPSDSAELWDPASGTFSAAGTLQQPRNHATATLLHDGRVIVVGGYAGPYEYAVNAVPTADLWDPENRSFSPTGSLATARAGHDALLLADGRVVVTGRGPAEAWDPATGTFRSLGAVPQASPTLLADGRILFVGGTSAVVWDPGGAIASESGALLSARTSHTATLLPDGRVLIIGGRAHPGTGETGSIDNDGRYVLQAQGGSLSRLASAELWDPATGQFSPAGELARGRIGHSATLLPDGRVLVLGGEGIVDIEGDRGFGDHPGAELWDPATRTFSAAPALAEARSDHSATLLPDGRVLVVGGSGPEGPGQSLRTAEIYDPAGTLADGP